MQLFPNSSLKIGGTIPGSFYEASTALVPKPDKENYMPALVVEMTVRHLSEILGNKTQQYMREASHHIAKWVLSQECKAGSTSKSN